MYVRTWTSEYETDYTHPVLTFPSEDTPSKLNDGHLQTQAHTKHRNLSLSAEFGCCYLSFNASDTKPSRYDNTTAVKYSNMYSRKVVHTYLHMSYMYVHTFVY